MTQDMIRQAHRIAELLSKIDQNRINRQEIEEFARICLRCAIVYIKKQLKLGRLFLESGHETEIEGVAADCIADLFTRDERGRYTYIVRFFSNLQMAAENREDYFLALRQLMAGRVKQHLTNIYRQRDPLGAKIRRSIKTAVKNNDHLEIIKEYSEEYIVYRKHGAIKETIFADIFEISAKARDHLSENKSTGQFLTALLSACAKQKNTAVAVNFKDVMMILREWRSALENPPGTHINQQNSAHSFQLDELAQAVDKILAKLSEKLQKKYVAMEKLSLEQALAIQQALFDMSKDVLQGERLEDNYAYLKKYWPDLSYKNYLNHTRKIFEYFVRLYKQELEKNIQQIF